MRKTRFILFILAFFGLGEWSFSENKIFAQNNPEKVIPLNVSAMDERFSLNNVSFYKRLEKIYATLNINFELQNKTDKDLKLKVILIAFKNIDSIDKDLRRVIKYPPWRKRDLDHERRKNTLLDTLPDIDKNAVDPDLKDPSVYPDYQKYLQYIEKNTSLGTDVVIKGVSTGAAENSGNQEIYIINQSMKTSVFCKLKVSFNTQNAFFNYFGIIIVDPEQKKIVGSDLYYFNSQFKTH
jgi:hypothetical protein